MSDEGPLHMAKTSTETDLEKSGNIYALQKYRYEQWWEYPTKIDFSALLETEVVLREIAQREMAVRDKLNRIIGENIEKGKGNRNVTLVQGLQGKLSKLAKQYWLLERLWWEIRSAYKDCPMTRGFDLWRSHPKWAGLTDTTVRVAKGKVDEKIDNKPPPVPIRNPFREMKDMSGAAVASVARYFDTNVDLENPFYEPVYIPGRKHRSDDRPPSSGTLSRIERAGWMDETHTNNLN
ncbi:hypothetical protein N7474_003240 [Penicillium riverlandense]|uniref:uncharacterized protein n=1 Tax=Penicillium riverlandense TaxID=1903569 RepID=UPI002546AD2D|nr:uncharacterized protein N7474_003240 [Penicillium riverlandense]KAJ5826102.1 hypothetical protein N7474_003240 [Penicillium riverlandense]